MIRQSSLHWRSVSREAAIAAATKRWGREQAAWLDRLARDPEAVGTIAFYTSGWSSQVNPWLRETGEDLGRVAAQATQQRALDRALRSAVAGSDITVFRGFRAGGSLFRRYAAMEPGERFRDFGWVSTSAVKHLAWSGEVLLEIKIPRGTRGVGWVAPASAHPQQLEVLIRRAAWMRVLSRGPAEGALAARKGWRLHLVVELLP